MVINPRGCSGSGKSTIVYEIMKKGVATPLDANRKPEGYRVDIPGIEPVYVVGPYTTVCGGTDAIKTQDEICDRVRKYAPQGHVLVEGLLMSSSFARYAMLDRELHAQGIHYIWAFLDTPLEVCLDRVRARRETRRLAKGAEFKELNPENTTRKWEDCQGTYQRCIKQRESDWKKVIGYKIAALDARWVDHTRATEQVFEWLCFKQ